MFVCADNACTVYKRTCRACTGPTLPAHPARIYDDRTVDNARRKLALIAHDASCSQRAQQSVSTQCSINACTHVTLCAHSTVSDLDLAKIAKWPTLPGKEEKCVEKSISFTNTQKVAGLPGQFWCLFIVLNTCDQYSLFYGQCSISVDTDVLIY